MRRSFWAFALSFALILTLAACSNRSNDPNNGNNVNNDDNITEPGATGAGTTTGVGRTANRNGDDMFNDADYYANGDGEVADFYNKYPNTSSRNAYNSLQQGLDDMTDGIRDAGQAITDDVRGAGRVMADELVQ